MPTTTRRIVFRDAMFDAQLLRTLGHTVYGGAAVGECLATARAIADGDAASWARGWSLLGARTSEAAGASARRGRAASAAGAYLRASNYFRNAYVMHLRAPLPEEARAAYRSHRAAFARAAALMPEPLEPFAVPFEGASMPGWFCRGGEGRRPVVVSIGGYDSTAEESWLWNGAAAVMRGYHAVVFDGPGQGAMLFEHDVPFRPDWERAVSAVLDWVTVRPDVDPSRIAIVGESFGGYLAPRAAARDPRVAACVVDPAQVSLRAAVLSRLPLPAAWKRTLPEGPAWLVALLRPLLAAMAERPGPGWALRRGMLTHGVSTAWDYFVDTARYDDEGVIEAIRCPTFVVDAADDDIAASARAFFDRLGCEKEYLRLEAEDGASDHCAVGNRALFHERVFDWLDARFDPPSAHGAPAGGKHPTGSPVGASTAQLTAGSTVMRATPIPTAPSTP
jgi:alpha-beta hydrolase superfamily lysophospholipase